MMKRKLIFAVGMLACTFLFSGNILAEEPFKGHFGFQTRKPFNDHYFNVRVLGQFGPDGRLGLDQGAV